jgi:hypothetical protein
MLDAGKRSIFDIYNGVGIEFLFCTVYDMNLWSTGTWDPGVAPVLPEQKSASPAAVVDNRLFLKFSSLVKTSQSKKT